MAIDNMRVCTSDETGVGEVQVATVPLWLEPAAPNPFATATELAYTLPSAGRLRLSVYDVPGRQVALLADEVLSPGRHIARWNGADTQGARLRAGVYFLRLEFAGQTETRKVVLVR
jgi:hypothetical protein